MRNLKLAAVRRLRSMSRPEKATGGAPAGAILAGRVEGGSSGADLVLRLQAHRQSPDV
jgi:hypothetical protein